MGATGVVVAVVVGCWRFPATRVAGRPRSVTTGRRGRLRRRRRAVDTCRRRRDTNCANGACFAFQRLTGGRRSVSCPCHGETRRAASAVCQHGRRRSSSSISHGGNDLADVNTLRSGRGLIDATSVMHRRRPAATRSSAATLDDTLFGDAGDDTAPAQRRRRDRADGGAGDDTIDRHRSATCRSSAAPAPTRSSSRQQHRRTVSLDGISNDPFGSNVQRRRRERDDGSAATDVVTGSRPPTCSSPAAGTDTRRPARAARTVILAGAGNDTIDARDGVVDTHRLRRRQRHRERGLPRRRSRDCETVNRLPQDDDNDGVLPPRRLQRQQRRASGRRAGEIPTNGDRR